MKLAKPRHRVMAASLDFIIFLTISLLFFFTKIPFIVYAIFRPSAQVDAGIIFDVFRAGVVVMTFLVIYFVAIPYYLDGQTLGKKVFRLKIVNEKNNKPSIGELFLREIIAKVFIDFLSLGLTIVVSFIIMTNREDYRSLSDIISKTKVIDLYEEENI